MGVPAGLLQDQLIEWMPEEAKQQRAGRFKHTEEILAGTGALLGAWHGVKWHRVWHGVERDGCI